MSKQFEQWREEQVKHHGTTQYKAEENIRRHESAPWETVVDPKNGQQTAYRKHIADKLVAKGKMERPRKAFSVPALPWKDG